LARRDCPKGADGKPAACRNVTGHFAHLSLGDLRDDEGRKKLASIPTGLTIADEDVDALIAAGHDAVLCDRDMRKFLESLPKAKVPPKPERCRAYAPALDEVKAPTANRNVARASLTDMP
jgi:hypothetical protein